MILLTVAFVFSVLASVTLGALLFVYGDDLEDDPVAEEVVDARLDAGSDSGVDAGSDSGVDAGSDAGVDAGFDAGVDAGSPRPRRRGGRAWWR